MSGSQIAATLGVSKSDVNDFLRAFNACKAFGFPLPQGITNYGIADAVYGTDNTASSRNLSYELPEYGSVARALSSLQSMNVTTSLQSENTVSAMSRATPRYASTNEAVQTRSLTAVAEESPSQPGKN